MKTFAEMYKEKKSIGNSFAEKFRMSDTSSILRSKAVEYQKKKNIDAINAQAEQSRLEAERLNSPLGLATETAKGVVGMGEELGKGLIGTTAAIGADIGNILTPWKKDKIKSVNLFGNEYITPSARGARGGELLREGKYKQAAGEIGTAGLDVISTFLTPFKGAKLLKGGAFAKGFVKGGTAAAPIVAGYGASNAAIEDKNALGILKDTAISGVAGFAGGGILGGVFSKLGSKLGNKSKIPVDFNLVDMTAKELEDIFGRSITPDEEATIGDLFSRGATKEEIVTEAGKAKIVEDLQPKPRLSQVVDQIEAETGKKLNLDETMAVKTGLEEGKTFEDVKSSLEKPVDSPVENKIESPETPLKSSTIDDNVKEIPTQPSSADEAFLKSSDELVKEAKKYKSEEEKQFESINKELAMIQEGKDIPETNISTIEKENQAKLDNFKAEKKVAPLARKVEERSIAKGIESELGDLAEYTPQKRKEQAELASILMQDRERTLDILYGFEDLPEGLSGEAFSLAIQKYGDAQMNHALKGSKIISDVAQGASNLSMRVGIGEDNVTNAIKKAEEAKKSHIKNPEKKVRDEKASIKKEIKSKRVVNIEKASKLLDSLICK